MILIYEFMRHFLSFSWFLLNCVINQIVTASHIIKKNNCHLVIGMETQSCTSFLIERVQRACCEFLGFRDRPQDKPPGHQEGSEGGREGAYRKKAYSQSLGHVWLCDPMDCGRQAPVSMESPGQDTGVGAICSRGSSQPRDQTCVCFTASGP